MEQLFEKYSKLWYNKAYVRVKNIRSVKNILLKKLKLGTKEILKIFGLMAIGFGLIGVIMLIKYKPIYEVSVSDKVLGYVDNKDTFKETIEENILAISGKYADFVSLNEEPEYKLKLVNRSKETNEEEIILALSNNAVVTYKYFAVALENKIQNYVDTLEEAQKVVEDIKNEYQKDLELDLQVIEKYTSDKDEINIETAQVAQENIEKEVETIIRENGCTKINGIVIASMPLDYTTTYYISSRYGEISRVRSSAHKGLDLACSYGTDIKAVADGKVIFSGYSGAYGYLVKVDHGNNVETWYAHCSKLNVISGQEVHAGDVISQVGSTGNSTGPHLHFEVRINGNAVNPQTYVYN